jgi:hypothetical protein
MSGEEDNNRFNVKRRKIASDLTSGEKDEMIFQIE